MMAMTMKRETVMEVKLRQYQEDAVTHVLDHLQDNDRIMLCAPTGAGKTEMAMELIRRHGTPSMVVLDRTVLVEQTSDRLTDAGIDHGLIYRECKQLDRDIVVASAQTLASMASRDPSTTKRLSKYGLWIIDEAHTKRKSVVAHMNSVNPKVVGLSATPFALGLKEIYRDVFNAATVYQLQEDGFLVENLLVGALTSRLIADMPGGKNAVSWGDIRGDKAEWSHSDVINSWKNHVDAPDCKTAVEIVRDWERISTEKLGHIPKRTLVFGAGVDHCQSIAEIFNSTGQYNFEVCTHLNTRAATSAAIERFKSGEIDGLCSVEKFAMGFDVPEADCILAARPYKNSFTYHMQQLGHVMRQAPEKECALYIDVCGNYFRFKRLMADYFENGCDVLFPELEKKVIVKRVLGKNVKLKSKIKDAVLTQREDGTYVYEIISGSAPARLEALEKIYIEICHWIMQIKPRHHDKVKWSFGALKGLVRRSAVPKWASHMRNAERNPRKPDEEIAAALSSNRRMFIDSLKW